MNTKRIYDRVGSNIELKTDTLANWIRTSRFLIARPSVSPSERILTADIIASPTIIAKAVRDRQSELEISLNLLNIYNPNYCSTVGRVKLTNNNIEYQLSGHYSCYPVYSEFEQIVGYRFFSIDNFNLGYIPKIFFEQQYWDKLIGFDYNVSFVSNLFPYRNQPNQRPSWTGKFQRNLLLTPFVTRDLQPIYELDSVQFRFRSEDLWQYGYFYIQDKRWALVTNDKIYFLESGDYIDILQLEHSTQQ